MYIAALLSEENTACAFIPIDLAVWVAWLVKSFILTHCMIGATEVLDFVNQRHYSVLSWGLERGQVGPIVGNTYFLTLSPFHNFIPAMSLSLFHTSYLKLSSPFLNGPYR